MTDPMTFTIEEDAAGQRVDAYLAGLLPDLSRARIQNMMASGHIHNHDGNIKPSHRLVLGEVLTVTIPEAAPTQMIAQELTLNVIYEDADIVVLNKPAGMVVHPGAGHAEGTLANALLFRYPDMQLGDVQRPGLVHRLDKDTSGLMVCARHDAAFASLTKQFKSREVHKIYRAFCFGRLRKENFELITGHARHKTDRVRFTTKLEPPTRDGTGVRLAHTRFKLLLWAGGVSEVEVELYTGRTHQIRAHLADVHHPILQDGPYGVGPGHMKQLPPTPVRMAVIALKRHALHAERLSFTHPTTGKLMEFTAELPPDMQAIHDAMTVLSSGDEER
jgi:23S rRNA pseudouridine1911/1915/1917 synthase